MQYREIPPTPALSDIVRYFWIIESEEIARTPQRYRLLAESSPGLVFFYHCNYGLISGLTDNHREFMMDGKLGIVGAYLFPYAVPLLFKETSEKLTNGTLEITDFLGNDGHRLREAVVNAPSNDHRISIIADYLLKKKENASIKESGLMAGIQQIVQNKGGISIDALVQQMGVSSRHFDRKFLPAVGIPPKVFIRLIRFQSTLQLPFKIHIRNLTDLALHSGYFDQSHFIRDFKEFSGFSPKHYFKMKRQNIADNFVKLS